MILQTTWFKSVSGVKYGETERGNLQHFKCFLQYRRENLSLSWFFTGRDFPRGATFFYIC